MALNLALIPLIDKVIDGITDYFPSAEQREAAKSAARTAVIEGRTKELSAELQAIVMEAQSEDPWTSRARPSFLYVVYLYILFAIPMGFLSWWSPVAATSIASGANGWLHAIPEQMWYLFGVGYLGYTGARTWDKTKKAELKKKQIEVEKFNTSPVRLPHDAKGTYIG